MKIIFNDLDILQNIFILLLNESENKSIINNKITNKNKIMNNTLLENDKLNIFKYRFFKMFNIQYANLQF